MSSRFVLIWTSTAGAQARKPNAHKAHKGHNTEEVIL